MAKWNSTSKTFGWLLGCAQKQKQELQLTLRALVTRQAWVGLCGGGELMVVSYQREPGTRSSAAPPAGRVQHLPRGGVLQRALCRDIDP